jgi:hypothetical protein
MKRFLTFLFFLLFPMTNTSQAQDNIAQDLFDQYDRFKALEITSRQFSQAEMLSWIDPLAERGPFKRTVAGTSAGGRTIPLFEFGSGPPRAFLWSQMHGDEPTATMALVDMMRFLHAAPEHPVASTIRSRLTLYLLPMINPDGAELFQRRTAQAIDLNRDAARLATPEARILKGVRDSLKPQFAFNLHDQSPRYTVGSTKRVAAFSLLAPPVGEGNPSSPARNEAILVAALIASTLNRFVPGHVSRYDDTFEPRAFGDNVQRWGSSTVLVESGGWPGDPEKMHLRKLNFVLLLTALYSIATGDYRQADPASYSELPTNRERLYDVIIRGATLRSSSATPPIIVDIGVNLDAVRDPANAPVRIVAMVMDIGDLSTYASFREVDGRGLSFDSAVIRMEAKLSEEQFENLLRR